MVELHGPEVDISLGYKFTSEHQLAILLDRHMGRAQAIKTCRELGWNTVLDAFAEQDRMVTKPQD